MITISGKNDKKAIIKSILSPGVIATLLGFLLFICRLMLPGTLVKALTYIGDMNTPMAMLVAGVTVAQTDFIKLFRKIRIYYLAFIKLIMIPVLMLLLFSLFPIPQTVLFTSILACACPTGAMVNLFSIKYEKNYFYASEIFALTTILSLFTIPLVMLTANLILK
jgi:predicted permease